MSTSEVSVEELPAVLPVFPLDGVLLPPRGMLPLNIFEPRYLNMIDDALAADRIIGVVQTLAGGDRARPKLMTVGGAGRITSFAETQDGRYLITLTGLCRFRLGDELQLQTPYRQVRADFSIFGGDLQEPSEADVDRQPLVEALKRYLGGREMELDWSAALAAPTEMLINSLAMALPFAPGEKQALLEAVDLEDRVRVLTALLAIHGAGEDGDSGARMQ
jgi:Lon protease-like protein